jgi:hypothetical protein
MKSSVVALMTLAVFGLSGAAFAGQATKPAAMTDAEMDKVTAGAAGGQGNTWGQSQSESAKLPGNNNWKEPGAAPGNSDFGHSRQ